MRILICRLPVLLLAALPAFPAAAYAADTQPLFTDHATLTVSIDAPIEKIRNERDSEEYHDGKFRYTDSAGEAKEFDIKLRARGRYRRQPKTCSFPPIRLNFQKKQLAGTIFEGQDKIKLVTHCQNESEYYEQLLLKEYLTYRMYQVFTDSSFRVRLLRITWTDNVEQKEPLVQYGFLLEDEELLGKRLGFELSEIRSTSPARLIASQAALAGVYEFFIGNTDFSMLLGPADEVCCHNVVLYNTPDGHLPIPYDFDFSGFVNATYAEPNPKLKIRSVTQRLYRGRCEHNDEVEGVLAQFRAKRDELFALLDGQEGLSERTAKSARGYLGDFYKIIETPKRVSSRILKKCV
ncbi:MAG: hypothetical protein WBM54_13370 [Woeseia sp.]